jgi:integrase/recombinase XerC
MELLAAHQSFCNYLKFEKRVSNHTLIAYEEDVLLAIKYLKSQYVLQNVAEINLQHLRSFMILLIHDLKLKPTSVKRKISSVNAFLKYLLLQGVIEKNPAKLLHLPKLSQRIPNFLDASQIDALDGKAMIEEKDVYKARTSQLILNLLYSSGMRRSELLNLKKTSIDAQRKELKVTGKGNKERIIPISSQMLFEIQEFLKFKEEEFGIYNENILTLKTGKPVSVNYIYRVVKKYLSQVSTLKKRSPHVLRHTFATHLLNNGADLSAIQKLLGHQSLAATQIYTHVNIEQLKDVYRKAHPKSTELN